MKSLHLRLLAVPVQVKTLEGTVSESMYYDKTRFLEMESEKKRLARLLAAAEEEGEATEAELERLKKALAVSVKRGRGGSQAGIGVEG